MSPLKVVYMGTPDFAVPALQKLHEDPRVEVVCVLSQPDRPRGRGKKLQSPPVAAWAKEQGIPVQQPESLKTDEAFEALAAVEADLFVVAAYGQILRQRVLDLPRLGCINIHASLLPAWRGAAPIQWSVAAGDAVSGVAIMQMERGLDTGPVYAMEATMIGETETAGELHDRLSELGGDLLLRTLDKIQDPDFEPTPQNHQRTSYARMLKKEDRATDFTATAKQVAHHVNGMTPWPGVTWLFEGGKLSPTRARLSSLKSEGHSPGEVVLCSPKQGLHVACGEGVVEVLEFKRPGKRSMTTKEALNGFALPDGTRFQS